MPIINKTKNTAAIFNRGREVVKVYDHGTLAWQKQSSIPDYLCFTALESGTFTLTISAAVTPTYLSYVEWSKDGRTWNHTDNTSEAVTIDVQVASGEKVYWRGNGVKYAASNSSGSSFNSTANFNASGNIMSLLYVDNFDDIVELPTNANVFTFLFKSCETIINAGDLLLPATRLRTSCYRSMFQGCKNLVTAPALPALKLVAECYLSMFDGCQSLVSAPALPATTIAGYCYYRMFFGCKTLVTAPALPATTMLSLSYFQMFAMCSSLTTAPALPATTLANSCYAQMFYDCTSLTSAPTLPATTMVYRCYYRMFEGCKFTSAPDLPATILANECYYRMFYNNINLNHVKCLATDISATDCLTNWLYNVSSTGTFIQASGATWPRGASGIPTGWVDVEKRTMPSGYKQVESITPTIGSYFQLTAYAMDNHYSIEIGYRGSSEEIADATHQHQIAGYNLSDRANLKQMCGYIYTRQDTGAHVWAQRNAGVYTNPNTGQQSINSSSLTSTFTLDTNPHTFVYLPDSSAESIKLIIDGTVVQTNGKTYYDAANQNPIPTGAPYMLYKLTTLQSLQRGTTYYLKGYASDNTSLVTDCVPCIRTSDNKVGLYDFVESTFEEGTGTFTAGEEI